MLLEVGGRRILFSGDLGRPDDMLMNPPDAPPKADTVLMESTTATGEHPAERPVERTGAALARLAARGAWPWCRCLPWGVRRWCCTPSAYSKAQGVIPASLKVFLDSPMAVSTTGCTSTTWANTASMREVNALEHGATMVQTPEQSKGLARLHGPMVILAASGMATAAVCCTTWRCTAGDHRNMIILTGHQAPGTRGARLADGERSIRIHGQDVAVRAEVVKLNSASAHADSHQLIAWLRSMEHAPDRVFVVHGEMECIRPVATTHLARAALASPGARARLHRRAVGWGLACVGCGNIAPNCLNFQKRAPGAYPVRPRGIFH